MSKIGYKSGLYLYLILITGLVFMGWNAREVLMILIVDMLISGFFACGRILFAGVYGPGWLLNMLTNLFSVGFYATIHATGWFIMTLFIVLNLESEWGVVDFMALKLTYFALLFGYSMEFVFGYVANGKFRESRKTDVFFGAFVRLVPYAVLLTFSAVLPQFITGFKQNNTILAASVIGMKGLLDYAFSRFGSISFNSNSEIDRQSELRPMAEKTTNAGIQTQSSLSKDPPQR
jgi:hypothetical protein